MNKQEKYSFVGYWFMRYLSEYIPVIKNQSHNTLTSYRDYYMQYLPFVAKRTGKHADKLLITDLTVERTNAFLNHIETRAVLFKPVTKGLPQSSLSSIMCTIMHLNIWNGAD